MIPIPIPGRVDSNSDSDSNRKMNSRFHSDSCFQVDLESAKSELQIEKAQLEEKLSEIQAVQEMEREICAHNSASIPEEQQWTVAISRKNSEFKNYTFATPEIILSVCSMWIPSRIAYYKMSY